MLISFAAVLALSGSPVMPVTSVRDSYPAPSPDGAKIAFQSNRSGRIALYLVDADGSNLRVLLDSGDNPVMPAWSPDGKKIAFAATVDGQSEIFVMDADGGNKKRLSHDEGFDSHPHWSTDGRIFFNSARATPDRDADWDDQWHEIFSMRADGSDIKQHTNCRAVCTFPSPSPDNKMIAYRKVIDGAGVNWLQAPTETNSEVFIANREGSGERNITNDPAFDGWPIWAPDSQSVIFASNRSGRPYVSQAYSVDISTLNVTTLTDETWANSQPTPSPDGNTVYTYRFIQGENGSHGHIAETKISD